MMTKKCFAVIFIFLISVFLMFSFASCLFELPITLNGISSVTVQIDAEIDLNISSNSNSTYSKEEVLENIDYSSNNEEVVIIVDGVIKSIGYGEAIVRATWTENPNVYFESKITVLPNEIQGNLIKEPDSTIIPIGESLSLETDFVCFYDTTVEWFSSDSSVAVVSNGTVTALQNGTCTITAKFTNENETVEKSIEFTVIQRIFNIAYDLDGGINSPDNPTAYTEQTSTILHNPTKEGYRFIGWYLDDECITEIDSTTTGNLLLVAKWESRFIEVTYNLNGGEWSWTTGTVDPKNGIQSASNLPVVLMGDMYYYLKKNNLLQSSIVSANLSSNGYFWSDFSKNYGDPVALYNWTSTGSYNSCDGYSQFFYDSFDGTNIVGGFFGTSPYKEKYKNLFSFIVRLTEIKYSDSIISDDTFKSKLGFVLDGYLYGTQGLLNSGADFEIFNAMRAFIPTTTISYLGSQISFNDYAITKAEDSINLVAPTREGYVFLGWYDNEQFNGEPLTTVTKSTTLYAKWYDLNPVHTILYELNGGINPSDAPCDYITGTGIQKLPVPTREGYIFLGWSENEFSEYYITTISKYDEKDFVLFANWEKFVDENMAKIFDIIRNAHNTDIHVTRDLYVAYEYYTDVFSSVSDLLFNYDYAVDSSLLMPVSSNEKETARPGTKINTMEFITVHYTAGTGKTFDAKGTAKYFNSITSASANFCTGNDGIYMVIPDGEVAWHAGDGTSVKFSWSNTGVRATANVKPIWGVEKNSKSSTGYYFTLNGELSSVEVPINGKTSSGNSATLKDPFNSFTFYGPAWKVVDGYYYMGTTWACFTQTTAGVIGSRGGNLNSVGIETACNKGSDLWLTYQITAQLVARLLVKYNLDTTRVVGHNMFTGKDCPQTLLAEDGELWYKFMECVESEYELYKIGNDYSIKCESNNKDLVDDNGRVLKIPDTATTVSYTVTVTNKTTLESKSETYWTVINGN